MRSGDCDLSREPRRCWRVMRWRMPTPCARMTLGGHTGGRPGPGGAAEAVDSIAVSAEHMPGGLVAISAASRQRNDQSPLPAPWASIGT